MNPWMQFSQATCLPDNCNCEFVRDAFLRQPSAFWSSLAYLTAAFILYRNFKQKNLDHYMWIGVCSLMGVSSLFGHASFIRLALAMDFASIILILSFFTLYSLLQLIKRPTYQIFLGLTLYYAVLIWIMYAMPKWTKVGICVLIFFFSIGDIVRELKDQFWQARSLQLSIIVLFISFGFFLMDEFRNYCHPHSLFQLHSIWHIGTAVSLYYYGKWRFDSRNLSKMES